MSDTPIIAPSILAANFTHLQSDIESSLRGGAQWIHCDIMDGHFVPNISYGPMIVKAVDSFTDTFLDVHLMIYNVDQYIPEFVNAGADLISIHIEAVPHIHRSLELIKSYSVKSGIVINPGTPVSAIETVLPIVDLVLVMSVNPGFGGQSFIDNAFLKIAYLKQLRETHNYTYLIEVDGGVNKENAEKLVRSGADVLVAGSSIYKQPDIAIATEELLSLARLGQHLKA